MIPRLLIAAATAFAIVILFAPAAHAHGPDGTIQFQPASQVSPLQVKFSLRLIYTNDTDGVEPDPPTYPAIGNVTGAGPSGRSVGPVRLNYSSDQHLGTSSPKGWFDATVTFPAAGQWYMTFTFTGPKALYTHIQNVTGPPTPTATNPGPSPTATSGPGPTVSSPQQTTSTTRPGSGSGNSSTTTTAPGSSSSTTETTEAAAGGSGDTTPDGTAPGSTGTTSGTRPPPSSSTTTAATITLSNDAPPATMNWAAVGIGAGLATGASAAALMIAARKPV